MYQGVTESVKSSFFVGGLLVTGLGQNTSKTSQTAPLGWLACGELGTTRVTEILLGNKSFPRWTQRTLRLQEWGATQMNSPKLSFGFKKP